MADENTQGAPGPSSAPADTSGAGSGPPSPSTPGAGSGASAPDDAARDAAAIFSFDPFGPAETTTQGQSGDGAVGTTETEQKATPTPGAPGAPAPSTPAEPAQAAPSQEVVELRARLQQLEGVLGETLRGVGTGTAKPDTPAAPTVEMPSYAFQIPDQIMALMASENPVERKQGVGVMLQGVARNVHHHVVTSMRRELAQVLPRLVTHVASNRDTARNVFQDFYGTYKELNVPELRPLIVATAEQVAQEIGATTWDDRLKKAIYDRVVATLNAARGQQNGGQVPQAPAPPAMVPSGVRNAPSGVSGDQKEMLDLLSYN